MEADADPIKSTIRPINRPSHTHLPLRHSSRPAAAPDDVKLSSQHSSSSP